LSGVQEKRVNSNRNEVAPAARALVGTSPRSRVASESKYAENEQSIHDHPCGGFISSPPSHLMKKASQRPHAAYVTSRSQSSTVTAVHMTTSRPHETVFIPRRSRDPGFPTHVGDIYPIRLSARIAQCPPKRESRSLMMDLLLTPREVAPTGSNHCHANEKNKVGAQFI
jgi:hypothetical protein